MHNQLKARFAFALAAATLLAAFGGGSALAHHGSYACEGACAKLPILFDKQFAKAGANGAPSGQPSEEWDGSASAPDPLATTGVADTREFTVLPGSDALSVEITWDPGFAVLYDLDLYIDRKTAFGTWQQVGDGTNSQSAADAGDPSEQAIVQRPEAGTYRTRVVNWASTQLDYHGTLWFTPATKQRKATAGRSSVDRPDITGGAKIHVIYFVPSDGTDNQLDINGVLENSVASMNTFLQGGIGRTLRLDTYRDGKTERLDVSFVRGELTAAEYATGSGIDNVTAELEHRGWTESGAVKRYFVYYEGPAEDSNICGTAYLSIAGGFAQWSIVWLGASPGCGARDFGTPTTGGGMSEAIALHENFHNEGMVPLGAPHQCYAFQFHLCSAAAGAALDTLDPESVDLLFPFVTYALRDKFVDPGHDDYYDHPFPYRDMADSPFWNG